MINFYYHKKKGTHPVIPIYARISAAPFRYSTFSRSHVVCAVPYLMKSPRYRIPITNLISWIRKTHGPVGYCYWIQPRWSCLDPWGLGPRHEVFNVTSDVTEGFSGSCVIGKTQFHYIWMLFLEIPDWRDDYDTIKIIDRGPPATLTPFYEGIKTPPPCITYHRHDPVMLAVKCKPRATGTLRTEYPQYVSVVLLVECIAHVSEYKPQILLMCVIFQNPHGVYVAFNKNIHSPEQLFCYIWSIFFCPLHHQDELHHHMSLSPQLQLF